MITPPPASAVPTASDNCNRRTAYHYRYNHDRHPNHSRDNQHLLRYHDTYRQHLPLNIQPYRQRLIRTQINIQRLVRFNRQPVRRINFHLQRFFSFYRQRPIGFNPNFQRLTAFARNTDFHHGHALLTPDSKTKTY